MSTDDKTSKDRKPAALSPAEARRKRLAEELRTNLRRRKTQARARRTAVDPEK